MRIEQHLHLNEFILFKKNLKNHLYINTNLAYEDACAGLTIRAMSCDCALNRMGLNFLLLFVSRQKVRNKRINYFIFFTSAFFSLDRKEAKDQGFLKFF
jgi:hypothetical protein